ncbi:GntR family transcriptional regulator [Allosaccharopolyspora coralli]|uniref:GntR family transcriptional regulator n=1 Tax=Allosaccharopolyspora coralli TaxID=2665642 RepID=A0A5Q3QB39_9PSEU|nr:GntR family transcriptional regulator [Allosaccharopolyspora coralli]QGK71603.1 GntR family transcriptional regulator [Allosaccharopolyspora coralli]
MPINQQGAQPLSAQIEEDLRRQITAGEVQVGAKLPSLRSLAEDYGVAELTVHVAVKKLQHEGVLTSVSGRGTFVSAKPDDVAPSDETSELQAIRDEVRELRMRVEAVEQSQSEAGR